MRSGLPRTLGLIVLVTVVLAAPTSAQGLDDKRVAVGVGLLPAGNLGFGIGVDGGVLLPFKRLGTRSLGIMAGVGFVHSSKITIREYAGGVRETHRWSEKLNGFVQGAVGISQRTDHKDNDPDHHLKTDMVFGAGGGISYLATAQLRLFVEGDLGIVKESTHTSVGVIITAGVSLPIGKAK